MQPGHAARGQAEIDRWTRQGTAITVVFGDEQQPAMVFHVIPHQVFLGGISGQRGMPLTQQIRVPDAEGFEVADHAFDKTGRLIARGVTEVDLQFDVRASRHEAHDAHLVVVRASDDDGA
ncbi:hypothetical protein AFM18_10835 [Achromobacter spanius]|uniref:Uncharacterized protein n=1 Tax=Achromobacter spanius TaxID=217203 RepID=A0AAW3I4Q0_9BURK|nr:hypothetical protein AFM18_10835 [Achromobacter spanius]